MQRSLPPNISIPHIWDHLGDGGKDDAMQYVICDLQYIVYIYMLCRYIIYNTAEVYPMFIYFVYVNSTSTIRRRSWSCHRRPGAADNSSCRPKLKLSGFQDLPELFSKVYSPVSTCIIHLYNIYIYICMERERERERQRDRERKIWKLKWNQATIQHSRGAKHPATRPWDRAQQARPGVLSSSTLAEAGKVLKSSYSFFLTKKCHVSPNWRGLLMNDGKIIELNEGVLSDQILILQTPPLAGSTFVRPRADSLASRNPKS